MLPVSNTSLPVICISDDIWLMHTPVSIYYKATVPSACNHDTFRVPIIDSTGKKIGEKDFSQYKFYKDEFWKENIDNAYNYKYGQYKNGKKDSIWEVFKRGNIEKILFYKNGIVIKDEIVNLTGTGDKRIRNLLIKRWEITTRSSMPTRLIPAKEFKGLYDYIEFRKNGIYIWYFSRYSYKEEGRWELLENGSVIKITSKTRNTNLPIDYISRYGLDLKYLY